MDQVKYDPPVSIERFVLAAAALDHRYYAFGGTSLADIHYGVAVDEEVQ